MPAPKSKTQKSNTQKPNASKPNTPKPSTQNPDAQKSNAPKPNPQNSNTPNQPQPGPFATGLVLAVLGFFFTGFAMGGGVDSGFLGAYTVITAIILLLSPAICRGLSENAKNLYIFCAFVAFIVAPLIIGTVGRAKHEEQKQIIAAEKEACEVDGYKWDYGDGKCDRDTETNESRRITCEKEGKYWWSDNVGCVSQEEAEQRKAKEQARKDCSAKYYYWNESADRCNTEAEQAAKKRAEAAEQAANSSSSSSSSSSSASSQWADPAAHFGETMTLTGKVLVDFAWGKDVNGYKSYEKIIPSDSNNYAFWLETSSGTAYVMGGKAFNRRINNGDTVTVTGTITSTSATGRTLWLSVD